MYQTLSDEQVKANYYKYQVPSYVSVSPKERKIQLAITKFGKNYDYWKKMTIRQLSGMLKSNK